MRAETKEAETKKKATLRLICLCLQDKAGNKNVFAICNLNKLDEIFLNFLLSQRMVTEYFQRLVNSPSFSHCGYVEATKRTRGRDFWLRHALEKLVIVQLLSSNKWKQKQISWIFNQGYRWKEARRWSHEMNEHWYVILISRV